MQVILTACFSVYLLKHPSSHPYPSAFPSREKSKREATSRRAFGAPFSCHSEVTPQHLTSAERPLALGAVASGVYLTRAASPFP